MIGYLAGSTVGKVVTDTVVSAAVGAIATGAAYAISGGKFSDGAKAGAIGGAIVGGGYSIMNQDWSNGLLGSTPSSSNNPAIAQKQLPNQGTIQANPSQAIPVQAPDQSRGLLNWSNWDAKDKELLGGALSGGAKGYFANQQAKEAQKAAAKQAQQEQDMYYVAPGTGRNWTPRAVVPRITRGERRT